MENLKSIKDRIGTVESIVKATNAMKMVSTVKLAKINNKNKYSKLCSEKLLFMLENIAGDIFFNYDIDKNHWLFRKNGKTLVLFMSTDQGFCGSFLTSLFEEVSRVVELNKECIVKYTGKKSVSVFGAENQIIVDSRYDIESHSKIVCDFVVDNIKNNGVSKVVVVSGRFKNVMVQKAESMEIFPVISEYKDNFKNYYVKTDSDKFKLAEEVFEMYMKKLFTGIITEHLVSELSARTMAMDNSVRNAKDMHADLGVLYNRLRQAKITQELTEIVSSIESVQ